MSTFVKTGGRSVPIIGLLFLLFCIGAALFALRAAAQERPPASVEEESATIKDDATVAPDAAQTADHSISFPVDI